MISIIIPVFNHAKALQACLASIAKQSYQDFEVIIVDDGSDVPVPAAETRFHLSKFQCSVNRIAHAGAPAARNHGFMLSRGSYVLFCDADVVMSSEMLMKMLKTLQEHREAAYAYSSFRFGWKKFKLWQFDADKLKRMNYIHTTSLIRRGAFPGFDESLKRFQDWDIWLTMLEKGNRGVWIPEVLFSVHSGGTMSRWLPKGVYALAEMLGLRMKRIDEYETARTIIMQKHNFLKRE